MYIHIFRLSFHLFTKKVRKSEVVRYHKTCFFLISFWYVLSYHISIKLYYVFFSTFSRKLPSSVLSYIQECFTWENSFVSYDSETHVRQDRLNRKNWIETQKWLELSYSLSKQSVDFMGEWGLRQLQKKNYKMLTSVF